MTTASKPKTPSQDRTVRTLLSVVEDLSVEKEEEGLLFATLEHVVRELAITGGVAFIASSEGGALDAVAEHGVTGDKADAATELAWMALQTGRPLINETETGWIAATPLSRKGRQLGVMAVFDDSGQEPPAMALLEALGLQIGTGLDNTRLYEELRRTSARTDTLNRIARAVSSGTELQAVMPAFAREMGDLEPFDLLTVAFVSESGDYLEGVTHPADRNWGMDSVIPVIGSGPGFVALNDRPIVQEDILKGHRFIEDMRLLESDIRSYVLFPLSVRDGAVGMIALGSREAGAYDEATIDRLQPLINSMSLNLEHVRLLQRSQEQSISDEVTPLFNLRFFHQILDRELRMVDRYESNLSLVFADLDRFKPINDQYGHLRGTRVLREVGFLIRMTSRETDYPVRYGGDEFCVVLPQTGHEEATGFGERLRGVIEDHVFLQEEGINATIGMSVGIATYPDEAKTKNDLIKLADSRMYADKGSRAR